jgi:hypothetical protein
MMLDRADGDTVQLKVRLKESARARLERAAKVNDWPLNREIASRIERSLSDDDQAGGPVNSTFLRLFSAMVATAEQRTGKRWIDDLETWIAVRSSVEMLLLANRPPIPNTDAAVSAEAKWLACFGGPKTRDGGADRPSDLLNEMVLDQPDGLPNPNDEAEARMRHVEFLDKLRRAALPGQRAVQHGRALGEEIGKELYVLFALKKP